MKKLLILAAFLAVLAIAFAPTSCGSKDSKSEKSSSRNSPDNAITKKYLNITVYLDLSDRLTRKMSPAQADRDTSIVSHLAEIFKKESLGPQLLNTHNHLKVMFYPAPNNSQIANIASNLNVDLATINVKERKAALQAINDKFKKGLEQVYSQTIQGQNWQGSDIWGFFDRKVVDQQCIRKDSRNILVILTDGYIYDENNKQVQGKSYNYILPQNLGEMESVITSRKGLGSLEVLMLEINPYKQTQRAKMISLLENWFKDMEVSKFVVADTDLPSNTNTVIDNFFNQQ